MDSSTRTCDNNFEIDLKTRKESLLLELIKGLCYENKLSSKLRGKVSSMISDNDLINHSSLHKLSTADESTSTLLGVINQTSTDLTYDEQAELNQVLVTTIQNKIPILTNQLETLKLSNNDKKSRQAQMKELRESIDDKLNILQEQENEKIDLMMEWLNLRWSQVNKFSDSSSEVLMLKTKILEAKSKILHLQVLQSIFTETNKSIEAYNELHKDLKDSIKDTEKRINYFKETIANDDN